MIVVSFSLFEHLFFPLNTYHLFSFEHLSPFPLNINLSHSDRALLCQIRFLSLLLTFFLVSTFVSFFSSLALSFSFDLSSSDRVSCIRFSASLASDDRILPSRELLRKNLIPIREGGIFQPQNILYVSFCLLCDF